MKKKASPNPKRTWVFALSVTAGVAGYVFLIFLPGERATAQLRQQFEDQKHYIIQCGALDAKIIEVERELNRTDSFIAAWEEASPHEARLAHVFVDITRHADKAGASIVRFEPQPAEELALLKRVPVEMALEGTFSQIYSFLARLESLEPDFWIDSLEIEPVSSESGRLRCELRLALFAGRPEISN